MIAHLSGTILDVGLLHVVLDVHGVGYLVYVTSTAHYTVGAPTQIHTYLAVRENALDLYGFETKEQLTLFHELIKIPKIGPKTALQILSQADMTIIQHAVITDDAAYLSKMSGIGKKSAEKIVQGLREILGEDGFQNITGEKTYSADTDVIDALIALGYTQRDAVQAVQNIPADIVDTKSRVKHALKYIIE